MRDFIFLGSKITADGHCSHEIKTFSPRKKNYDQPTAAAAKLLQSCPTLCNPIDSSPPGSSIPGILQARILEGVAIAISFSMTNLDSILKSRDITLPTKVRLVKAMVFHVSMWELDCEESWVLKNWSFWTVVLEKTLESPLDSKEIQPVHPKGNKSWIFIGKTDA